MTVLAIREGRAGDCAAVSSMVQDLARMAHVEAGITPAILEREAFGFEPTLAFLVAEGEDGLVNGLLGCLIHQPTFSSWRGASGVFVVDLFVRPDLRGRGIGLALLREAARQGLERGAQFMRLDVEPDNEAAIRFYRKLGFHTIEHRFEALETAGMARLAAGEG